MASDLAGDDLLDRCYCYLVLLSPPCSTFSRAPCTNFKGPRPVRSYAHPRGLLKLTASERDRCMLGNIFADFTREVVEAAIEVEVSFFLLEQSEDLGTMARGPYKGQRPASMWQWPQAAKAWANPRVQTLALHQASFGAPYPKPNASGELPMFCYEGPPTYDSDGNYAGPLPLHWREFKAWLEATWRPVQNLRHRTMAASHVPLAIVASSQVLFCYCYNC